MTFVHWSPAHIRVGGFMLPMSELGGRARSFGGEHEHASQLDRYDQDRVYVMQTCQLDPRQWFGQFTFTRRDYYFYEVEPEDLGPDSDQGQVAMGSLSCARARVIRCLYSPAELSQPVAP